MTVLFGYQTVTGVPRCPCGDPGDYLALEQPGDDPLVCELRCWCGRTMKVTFDTMEERTEFIARQGGDHDPVRTD